MVSRENSVLLASTGTVLLVLVVVAVADVGENAVLAALVFAGLGVLAPQLYLAATDDEVAPRTRIRVGVGVTLFLLWGQSSTVEGSARAIVGGASAVLLLALLAYEFRAGYRSATG